MNKIILLARAKLNLSLDITGLRADGYHLMDMVMQSVSLSDCVALERSDDLSPNDFEYGESDTGYRAAKLFLIRRVSKAASGYRSKRRFRHRPEWQAAARMLPPCWSD